VIIDFGIVYLPFNTLIPNSEGTDADKKTFEQEHGRPPSQHELPYIHPAFCSYKKERKNKLISCIKEKTRTLLEMDDNARIKVSLQLWSGCTMTSKEISAGTQSGPNTSRSRRKQFEDIINPRADAYSIFKVGEKIAPFFKRDVGQENDVFFDVIPAGSAVLEVKDEFNKTRRTIDSSHSKNIFSASFPLESLISLHKQHLLLHQHLGILIMMLWPLPVQDYFEQNCISCQQDSNVIRPLNFHQIHH
jgi:hypothetical protein